MWNHIKYLKYNILVFYGFMIKVILEYYGKSTNTYQNFLLQVIDVIIDTMFILLGNYFDLS